MKTQKKGNTITQRKYFTESGSSHKSCSEMLLLLAPVHWPQNSTITLRFKITITPQMWNNLHLILRILKYLYKNFITKYLKLIWELI